MPRLTPSLHPQLATVRPEAWPDDEIRLASVAQMAGWHGRSMPPHFHDRCYQLHFIRNGGVTLCLNDRRYRLEGPMCFLTPPAVVHAFSLDPACEGHVLTLRQQWIWPLLDPRHGLVSDGRVRPLCVAAGTLAEDEQALLLQVDSWLELLASELAAARAAQELIVAALLRLIFVSLLRLGRQAMPGGRLRRHDVRLFRRFNALIEQHYREHWPLLRYAREVGVTSSRLNEVCRLIAGRSSKRLVFERLTDEARRQLRATGASTSEIAYALGFKDPAYFSRFFARHAGVSPGAYRLSGRAAPAGAMDAIAVEGAKPARPATRSGMAASPPPALPSAD